MDMIEELSSGGRWRLAKSIGEDASGLKHYLDGEDDGLYESGRKVKLPGAMSILAIRNAVIFPGTVTPLAIGRDRSRRLLEDVKANESVIGLVTQRDPETETPGFGDIYSVGTAGTVLKVIRMPQDSLHIIVHGVSRFKIVKPVATEPYLKAKVHALVPKMRMTKRLQALMVNVRRMADRVITLSPNVPEEASLLLDNIEDPSALADFLAANLSLRIGEKQELLEQLDATKRLESISVALANQLEVLELSHKIQGLSNIFSVNSFFA